MAEMIYDIHDIHDIYGMPYISLTLRKYNQNFNKTWRFLTHLMNSFF